MNDQKDFSVYQGIPAGTRCYLLNYILCGRCNVKALCGSVITSTLGKRMKISQYVQLSGIWHHQWPVFVRRTRDDSVDPQPKNSSTNTYNAATVQNAVAKLCQCGLKNGQSHGPLPKSDKLR